MVDDSWNKRVDEFQAEIAKVFARVGQAGADGRHGRRNVFAHLLWILKKKGVGFLFFFFFFWKKYCCGFLFSSFFFLFFLFFSILIHTSSSSSSSSSSSFFFFFFFFFFFSFILLQLKSSQPEKRRARCRRPPQWHPIASWSWRSRRARTASPGRAPAAGCCLK